MSWILDGDDDRLPDLWPSYADIGAAGLVDVLAAAAEQCHDYYPTKIDGSKPAHIIAQALQARALVRAGFVGSGDSVGGSGETVTVFPMDWQVKNLLRPKKPPVCR